MTRKTKSTLLIFAIVLLALITTRLIRSARTEVASDGVSLTVPVAGLVVTPQAFVRSLEETGTLQGNREAVISAEVGGRVTAVAVEAGEQVAAGAPLARLDDELLGLEAERAKVGFDKATLDFERVRKLHEQRSVSDSELEGARLGMKGAEVAYRLADKNYRDGTVRAPFAGSVASRFVEVGQMLERGMPVAQIVDASAFKITVQISEAEIPLVKERAPATVIVETLADSIGGEVYSIGSRAAPGSRTYPVEVKIPGRAGLKSGMFARVIIAGSTDEHGLLIPRAAALVDMGRLVVFVARGQTAHKVAVKTLGTQGDLLAVSGIEAGDTVIVTGNQLLAEGTPIQLSLRGESR
ncbi:efflux RND transporter periplasmic adaptor subunit [candidate division KSB1 bacterium]|nr:efflux RND transporter periplasmic adaptor subunit [candidate division KSB1 bacterium]